MTDYDNIYDLFISPVYENIRPELKLLGVDDNNKERFNYRFLLDIMYNMVTFNSDLDSVISHIYLKEKKWFDSMESTYYRMIEQYRTDYLQLRNIKHIDTGDDKVIVDNGFVINRELNVSNSYVNIFVDVMVNSDQAKGMLYGIFDALGVSPDEDIVVLLDYGSRFDIHVYDFSKKKRKRNVTINAVLKYLVDAGLVMNKDVYKHMFNERRLHESCKDAGGRR